MGKDYELHTDTHLAKDFNKVLQDCMLRCNSASYIDDTQPHYEHLILHYSAVKVFFVNTFHLFSSVKYKNSDLMTALIEQMQDIKKNMLAMRYSQKHRTREVLQDTMNMCDLVHMMIMFGLQRRNMLVRMSENEPRGIESIEHWKDKQSFSKGDLTVKRIKHEDYDEFII